ncbi:hypothetical protein T02_7164 [Trichinella nativa]|uniref:Uncharacterized protein n=1 Tax=Trichinella nativa TaxID=6335 RepID=A0A0V1LI38_9BILA|nr:hypothetical protein T02_7164 [Trichinella nativa]
MLVSRVWFTNNNRREQKETINQLTISYLPITFGVSEKRLLGYIKGEMRSDTPPRYVGERSGWVFHFEEDRHDENRASTSIQLAHLTRKSSKHGSEDYGYDGEGADDGRERRPEENLPLMIL